MRFAAKAMVVVLGAFFALLLAIRLVAYPQLEAHRVDIARWLGARIGQPVEIDRIVTGWQGWNPRLSIRGFRVRERQGGATLLELPRVDLLIAWTSLPLLDLRLKELSIDSPRLSVRRDVDGRLHVAGFDRAAQDDVDDSAFAGWLMRQPQVIVRDALVAWNDELRRAPQLLLDHVQFRLEQRFGRHQAGLTGVPPAELAAPIDLRADLTGRSLKDLASLRGKLYFRLDYADVAAWRDWLSLPFAIESGRGALRVWVDVAGAQATGVTADLELADVRATLGENLPPLALAHVAGRAQWAHAAQGTQFAARHLSLALPDGTGFSPTDFELTLRAPAAGAADGAFAFGEADLRPLAAIAAHLPLSDTARRDIARFAPRGTLRNGRIEWTGDPAAPQHYRVKLDVAHLSVASQDGLPGATNLSGSVDANESAGDIRLATEQATLALPRLFGEPLAFDSVKGDVHWQHVDGALRVQWKDIAFDNADVAGTTGGTWRAHPEGPGDIDLAAQLTRANLASAHRYVPVDTAPAVRSWLRRALVKGTSDDAQIALVGDLARFPFSDGKAGRFELAAKARDTTLDYADRWPPITGITAELRIDGSRLVIDASSARVQNVQVAPTHVEIADLHEANPVLRVDGTASGQNSEFLAFVAASPVTEWIGHVNDDALATGDGRLSLAFALPLHDPAQTTIAGDYRFASASLQLAGAPPLSNVAGDLAFTELGVHAAGVTAQAFGGPAELAFATDAGHVRVTGSGAADVERVRQAYDVPLLAHVSGNTDWRFTLDAFDGQWAWTIESSLAGAAVNLPAPIGKQAGETVPVRIDRRAIDAQEDRISVDYGRIARVLLHRHAHGATPVIDRALVLVGKSIGDTGEPAQSGIWIRADLAALDVDDWLAVDVAPNDAASQDAHAETLAINGVDLHASSVTVLGRTLTRLETTARRQNADWRLALDGDDLSGTGTWRSATATQPNGRLIAHLTRLTLPPAAEAATVNDSAKVTTATTAMAVTTTATTNHWPAVDLVADTVMKKGRALGRLELRAQPSGADWQIRKLALTNEAGRIDAQGSWRNAASRSQTELDVAIDVKEAGAFLGRFGWPDALKGAPTKIEGQVSWAGAPGDFDYPSLAGRFKLHAGAGQFTKLEPGVGRLLGVLSLQALPRRISLDFRDVFSEGFAFDTIAGDVRMERGVMHTDDLRLVGPAAAVNIAGDVDLAQETQQLRVRVQPSLSTGVSAGAAVLFIANPLLGVAVGAGTLLAQKMLNNPFDQLFSYQYVVSGGWDDPVVTRPGARAGHAAHAGQSPATGR